MLRRILLFAIVVATIWGLQVFDTALIMTAGGPGTATTTIVYRVWQYVFAYDDKIGLAAAMSAMLVVAILVLTLVQMRALRGHRPRRRLMAALAYAEGGGGVVDTVEQVERHAAGLRRPRGPISRGVSAGTAPPPARNRSAVTARWHSRRWCSSSPSTTSFCRRSRTTIRSSPTRRSSFPSRSSLETSRSCCRRTPAFCGGC